MEKTPHIFPEDAFDTPDDSVVHHWKARSRQSSRDQSASGNVLDALPGSRLPPPGPCSPCPGLSLIWFLPQASSQFSTRLYPCSGSTHFDCSASQSGITGVVDNTGIALIAFLW